jgi:hypothetical protein
MPIRQYLNGERIDFETTGVSGVAVLFGLGNGATALTPSSPSINRASAGGEHDADRLCDYALAVPRSGGSSTNSPAAASQRPSST